MATADDHGVLKYEKDDDDAASVAESATGRHLPAGYYWSPNFIGTWASMAIAQCCIYIYGLGGAALLYTVINPDIGPSSLISWFSIGRTTSQAVGFILFGRLSDIFGRRYIFIAGDVLAVIGCIISATSTTVAQLCVGSVMMGFGEAVMNSFVVALAELVKNKHRPYIISSIYLFAAPFTTFSPLIATTMISHGMTWRWVFWVSTIGCGVALVLLVLCYHPPHYDQLHSSGRHTISKQLRELDYIGIFFFVAGLTLLLLPISWGGTLYPWKSAATIATLIIGVLLLVALGLWETYKKQPIPLMPIGFFRNIGFMSIVLVASSGACVYYPATLLWPQQVAKQYGITGQHAGWLACTVGGATSAGTSGGGLAIWLVGGKSRGLLIFLSLVMVSLIAALAAQGLDGLLLGTVLTSVGPVFSGLIESISLGLAPLFCPPQDLGLAAGMLGTIRSAVASIATAIYTSVYQTRLSTTIPLYVTPAAEQAGFPASNITALISAAAAGTYAKLPGITPNVVVAVKEALPSAYVASFRTVYLTSIAFGGLSIIGAVMTSSAKTLLNDKVSRKLQGKKPHLTRTAEPAV
ncbi:hypothetical protein Sste5344_010267 [Sporothrix stenoceras]